MPALFDEMYLFSASVQCLCGMQVHSGSMIQCSTCFIWLHRRCLGLDNHQQVETCENIKFVDSRSFGPFRVLLVGSVLRAFLKLWIHLLRYCISSPRILYDYVNFWFGSKVQSTFLGPKILRPQFDLSSRSDIFEFNLTAKDQVLKVCANYCFEKTCCSIDCYSSEWKINQHWNLSQRSRIIGIAIALLTSKNTTYAWHRW
jgi:hypothetical protein